MPTIKGRIEFKKGEGLPQKILDAVGEMKLPFKATGFTYANRKIDNSKFKFSDNTKVECIRGELRKRTVLDVLK